MDAPIGVFDSGVGGLTVLRALTARLPHENTIYLGDTARVPYGTRSREVVTRYALLCVQLAEEGWTEGEVPRLVAERYLGDLRRAGADTVLLGCTHYPLLANAIAEVMGPGPALVDSADATADAVARLLQGRGLARREGDAQHRTLCTDVPERFHHMAERFLGRPVGAGEAVDLSRT